MTLKQSSKHESMFLRLRNAKMQNSETKFLVNVERKIKKYKLIEEEKVEQREKSRINCFCDILRQYDNLGRARPKQ